MINHPTNCQCNDCENSILAAQIAMQERIIKRMASELGPVMRQIAHRFWMLQKTDGERMDFETAWKLNGND